jgi:hypothetical protein
MHFEVVAEGFEYPEGPVVMPDGSSIRKVFSLPVG